MMSNEPMRDLFADEFEYVNGAGALGTAIGMVIGGAITAVAAMAATAATGGAAAAAIGIVAAGARVGGQIGSAIEDGL